MEKECVGDTEGATNATELLEPVRQHISEPLLDCGLYMAPSSISNAGWGMYAGKSYNKGETLEPLDLAIQIVDHVLHMETRARVYNETLPEWLINMYHWIVETTDAERDGAENSLIPSFGAIANHHPAFTNIKPQGILIRQQVDRSAPEAGAFTEYKGMAFVATKDIPIGHEISVPYGSEYFSDTPLPSRKQFKKADKLLNKFNMICRGNLTTGACKELWQMIRHGKNLRQREACHSYMLNWKECMSLWKQQQKCQAGNPELYRKGISALPERLDEVNDALATGCALHSAPNVLRSSDWLEENGICLDHMEPRDESTIPQAGSGAFATRSLPKGSMVAPAPVIHMHRGHMDILIPKVCGSNDIVWKGSQLLLNYAYGHPSTSLLFFPYSPVVNYINHSPTPNIELQWLSQKSNREWMNMSTSDLMKENTHSGLMMEIVALRDIEEGEEVFLNYGSDWQQAWDQHVKTWEKPLDYDLHGPVEPFNDRKKLPTKQDDGDSEIEQLPRNAMAVCLVDLNKLEVVVKGEVFKWLNSTDTEPDTIELYECALLERKQVNDTFQYAVNVRLMERRVCRINDIHRRGIHIVERSYSSNQYLRQSFRHEIHLPDHMIPVAWKDRETA